MPQPRRWLYPCSESKVLRQLYRQGVVYESYVPAAEPILYPGSDEDLDTHHQHTSKRRRIESLAHSYLAGKPFFIQSAALKGPFGPAARKTDHKYDDYVIGSPITESATVIPSVPAPVETTSTVSSSQPWGAGCATETRTAARYTRQKRKRETTVKHCASGTTPTNGGFKRTKLTKYEPPSLLPSVVQPSSLFQHASPSRRQTPDPQSDEDDSFNSPLPATPSKSRSSPSKISSQGRQHPSTVTTSQVPPALTKIAVGKESSLVEQSDRFQAELNPEAQSLSSVALQESGENGPLHANQIHTVTEDPTVDRSPSQPIAHQVSHPLIVHHSGFTPINRPSGSLAQPLSSIRKLPGFLEGGEERSIASPAPFVNKSSPKCPPSEKVENVRNYLEAVITKDDSPFLIRRRKHSRSKASLPTVAKEEASVSRQTRPATGKGRKVLFDSSISAPASLPPKSPMPLQDLTSSTNVPTPQPPKSLTPENAPAIDISFDQDSLAMNFDLIDRYTNTIVPASNSSQQKVSLSQQIRQVMRESGAALIGKLFGKASDQVKPMPLSENAASQASHDEANHASAEKPGHFPSSLPEDIGSTERLSSEVNATEDVEDDFPYINTQAAMQEAHRALFEASSPTKPSTDEEATKHATPEKQAQDSTVHTITPFHEFNAQLTVDDRGLSPLPNTQALMANMSPLISPELSRTAALQTYKNTKSTGFATIPEESNNSSFDLSAENLELSENLSSPHLDNMPPTSVSIQKLSSQPTPPDSEHDEAANMGSIDGAHNAENSSSEAADGTNVASPPSSRSSSPDIVFSQRSAPLASQRDPPSILQNQSVRLSDVFGTLQSSKGSSLNIEALISSASSSRTKGKGRSSRKSQVPIGSISAGSSRLSSSKSCLRQSLSQPLERQTWSSRLRCTRSQPSQQLQSELTRNTVIADKMTVLGLQQEATTVGDMESSNMFERCLPDQVLPPQASALTSALATTTRSGEPPSTTMSSFQAAQLMDDFELDATIDDITASVLSPWQ